ncbi:TetR/AcrR family transcriptional regulator [Streptomyces massasporeus]
MVGNPGRRAALVDAGVEVLAREGARGLTFRAVDAQAGVPVGTASNYFRRRPELLASYTTSVRGDLEEAMEFHRTAGLPGGGEAVTVLYLAMLGVLLEHLTLPGGLDGALPGVGVPDGLVERIVATVLPEEGRAGEAGARRRSAV